jgi:phosphopantothenoylcysteine decarboxylase/phosphopantothenate--cysteine ligase
MHVIVGITGGIAAYKATGIIRLFTEAGHTVKVIPTHNALRFIGAATLEALSHNSVDPDLYTDVESVKHVQLGQEADLVVVAPASASFLARYAAGIADDLLGNTLLVTKAPVVVAPAMHTEMWNHEATQNNVKILESRGVRVLAPESGRLTGSDSGTGRLPEPETIVSFALGQLATQDLSGRKFLVTAGGTREPIDPVRYLGNRSSGKQGIAIALEAQRRGAHVVFVAANIASIPGELADVHRVQTASELSQIVYSNLAETDCLVMAAAVADYSIQTPAESKLKKASTGTSLVLNLVENEDILRNAVSRAKQNGLSILTVGFAAETSSSLSELSALAVKKLADKGCDLVVANDVSNGKTFDSDSNDVLVITKTGGQVGASGSKSVVAAEILDVISGLLNK